MPPFRRRAAIGLVAAAVVWVAWQATRPHVILGEHVCSLMGRVVEIRGRLLDSRTGGPLAGVGVQAVEHEDQATDPKTLAAFSWRTSATRAAREGAPPVDEQSIDAIYSEKLAHALTGADGSFRVIVNETWCVCTGEDPRWPERRSIHGVIAERRDAAPWVLTPPPTGTWTVLSAPVDRLEGPSIWWDLGDIVVPEPHR